MRLAELQAHLHSLPTQPDLIPYRTSYYTNAWGFCLADRQRAALRDENYDVCIDSTLEDGSLTYGEAVLPGETDEEVLFHTHTCHPSLANDNLSGIAVCACLARQLAKVRRRFTYRFVLAPGTIGSLVWLSRNQDRWPRIRHGLVLVSLGDGGPLRYKRSRRGASDIDRAAAHALESMGEAFEIEPFSPYGYDERQFGSPGINLPVGRLSRSAQGAYREYHTSADNLDLVQPDALARSLDACLAIVSILERDCRYLNTSPCGEPQLGRRGLYRSTGGNALPNRELAMLWTLNLSDGAHSLLDIAERAGLEFALIAQVADELIAAGLLEAMR
jgi:aminopeptidase-like protein